MTCAVAGKVFPEAGKVFPEAGKVFPEAEKVFPEAEKVFPEAGKVFPEAGKVFSEAAKVFQKEGKAFAEARKALAMLAKCKKISVGPQGPPEPEGSTGPQGPPFASAIVDSTETSLPGSQAAVTATFDGNDVHFTFSIPQGIPGEVSMSNLTEAISFTSSNTNGVGTLDVPSPTIEELTMKLNELILALRR